MRLESVPSAHPDNILDNVGTAFKIMTSVERKSANINTVRQPYQNTLFHRTSCTQKDPFSLPILRKYAYLPLPMIYPLPAPSARQHQLVSMKINTGPKYGDDEARARGDASPNVFAMLCGALLCCPCLTVKRVCKPRNSV
jgi:hypothetical protein